MEVVGSVREATRDGEGHTPVASGYLFKLARSGTPLARWHRRYYVLYSDGLLHSYKTVRSRSHHRTIPVGRQCLRTRFGEETAREGCKRWPRSIPPRLRFSIVNSDRAFHFVCESERELALWRENLKETLRRLAAAPSRWIVDGAEDTHQAHSDEIQPGEILTTCFAAGVSRPTLDEPAVEWEASGGAVMGEEEEEEKSGSGDEEDVWKECGGKRGEGEEVEKSVEREVTQNGYSVVPSDTPSGAEVGVAVDPDVQEVLQSVSWAEEREVGVAGETVQDTMVAEDWKVASLIESSFSDMTSPETTPHEVPMAVAANVPTVSVAAVEETETVSVAVVEETETVSVAAVEKTTETVSVAAVEETETATKVHL